MPLYDYMCEECGYVEDRFISYEERDTPFSCPSCEGPMRMVWLKAPNMGTIGKEGSDTEIAAMKRSFKQRAVKREFDDIRHKHGKAFDDSLVAGAAKRVREKKKDDVGYD